MAIYYVATRARYVLVDAEDQARASAMGHTALQKQYADVHRRLGKQVPIDIHTIRRATDDEIKLVSWHDTMVAREEPTTQR